MSSLFWDLNKMDGSIGQAMAFMGPLSNFISPTGVRYVGAHFQGQEILISVKNERYLFTINGKLIVVCEKETTPILETLAAIKGGDLNPPRNKAALDLERQINQLKQWRAEAERD